MEGNEKTDGNASLGYFDMNVFVSAGMEKNLRPDVLMNAFQEICRQEGNAFEIESISVVRNAVYTKAETEGEDFISPMHEAALCSGDANSGNGPGSTGLLRDAAGNDKSS